MRWTPLSPGSSLVRWATSRAEECPYPGVARPMPDTVDYRFRNGHVDVGLLPCREALLAALPGRRVDRPKGPFDGVHAGNDTADVDYSCFRHRPTLVRRGFLCSLRAEEPGTARFRLATCGGVHLWLDDAPAGRFEPFTRNTPQATEIALELSGREQALALLLEDLHERDTTCFFRLTYLGGVGCDVTVPGVTDPARLDTVAATLDALRVDAVFTGGGTARLVADPPPETEVNLSVEGLIPFARGGLSVDPEKTRRFDVTLAPGAPHVPLFESSATSPGCLSLTLSARVGKARIERRLGTTNLPPGAHLPGPLAQRKAEAARIIAARDGLEPSVAALLGLRGERPDFVSRGLDAALPTIEERHDCSDFTILPLLRLWRDGRDRLDGPRRARLKRAFLGYRYWLTEPGDDVMWFWSENHVLCFHTAQLVAGGLFPDEVFSGSGQTGAALAAEALPRLHRWFDSIDSHGLCEWNSAAYYPIDLLALFTLHDMAPALRDRARALLDRLFLMTGLHTTGGVPAGSQGRCYEKELLAGPLTELGSVAAIAFGAPFRAGHDRAAALFCLSDYAPPPEAQRFAWPEKGERIEARYTQGLDHAGKLTLWKSAQAQLSTVTGLPAGERGHQAQVLDVQMAGHPMARLWINHPGELKVWGERRPSLLAGSHVVPQVAQKGPVALAIFDIDRPWTDIRFTQLFATAGAFRPPVQVASWLVFRCAGASVAAWCSRPHIAGWRCLCRVTVPRHGRTHRLGCCPVAAAGGRHGLRRAPRPQSARLRCIHADPDRYGGRRLPAGAVLRRPLQGRRAAGALPAARQPTACPGQRR